MDRDELARALSSVEVVREREHGIFTFGETKLPYYIASPIDEFTVIRKGYVLVKKPLIIRPSSGVEDYLSGFEADEETLHHMARITGLSYTFHNELESIEQGSPHPREVLDRLVRELEEKGNERTAVMLVNESIWGIAAMRYALDTSDISFNMNLKDLEERGFI